jgi:MinD superfamily P-loop ATPase
LKEITVISGKGGTGKTSITAALASVGKSLVLCDSDVDAADLHLILKPTNLESFPFEGSWIASFNPELCTNCGLCSEHCRFNAISWDNTEFRSIDPFRCEGCRLCERICHAGAIRSTRSINNHWFISDTRMGKMTHASMGPGEENSGKLVTKVRTKAINPSPGKTALSRRLYRSNDRGAVHRGGLS